MAHLRDALRIVTRRVRFVIGEVQMTVRYPEHS